MTVVEGIHKLGESLFLEVEMSKIQFWTFLWTILNGPVSWNILHAIAVVTTCAIQKLKLVVAKWPVYTNNLCVDLETLCAAQ